MKKKNKKTKPACSSCFFLVYLVGVFSFFCRFLDFGFLVCFFCSLCFSFYFFVKPYILCVAGLRILVSNWIIYIVVVYKML